MCICHILKDCEETNPTRREFISGFEKLDASSQNEKELYRCKACGQHWIVENDGEMDRRQDNAYKIVIPNNWQSYNTKPSLVNFLIQKQGGFSGQKCMQAGCNEQALKNMYLCAVHGHSQYNW